MKKIKWFIRFHLNLPELLSMKETLDELRSKHKKARLSVENALAKSKRKEVKDMKRKIIILVLAFLLIIPVAVGNCWTYEGEFDPNEFDSWGVVDVFPCPDGMPDIHIILRNPDGLKVEIVIDLQENLLGYAYTKDGIDYIFVFDPETEIYKQILPEVGRI